MHVLIVSLLIGIACMLALQSPVLRLLLGFVALSTILHLFAGN
jgi:hypothetical protein